MFALTLASISPVFTSLLLEALAPSRVRSSLGLAVSVGLAAVAWALGLALVGPLAAGLFAFVVAVSLHARAHGDLLGAVSEGVFLTVMLSACLVAVAVVVSSPALAWSTACLAAGISVLCGAKAGPALVATFRR